MSATEPGRVSAEDRAEIFGAWTLVRRIDRDVRPIFLSGQTEPGGLVNDYPFMRSGWSDNRLGDFWVGGKVNLLSEYRQNPVALAVRGMLKLPLVAVWRVRSRSMLVPQRRAAEVLIWNGVSLVRVPLAGRLG